MAQRIVILGAGFGGAYLAQALEKRVGPDTEIVLIDRNNYFVFYPLLVEAGTGNLHPRHTVVPIRSFIDRTRFRMAEVESIDPQRQLVTSRLAETGAVHVDRYDHLVVALGSVTRMPPIPGLAEHGFGMKSITDAVTLRDRAIRLLETANATDDPDLRRALLHFVVVGGNFTGVEVAGEFFVFLREAAESYPRIDPRECRLTLVEMLDRILAPLGPELGDYATGKLQKRGIGVLLRTGINEIRPREVVLSDGTSLPTATVIWCGGISPNPLVKAAGLPVDEKGYLRCDRTLRVVGFDNVWGLGDTANVPDVEGKPHPATAQNATQQAEHLAESLPLVLRGRQPAPYVYRNKGALAALGCRTGVAKVFGIRLSGFAAWFLWRSVYLMKMPGFSHKLRVALDWTVDLLFRREVVQLGVHRDAPPEAEREREVSRRESA